MKHVLIRERKLPAGKITGNAQIKSTLDFLQFRLIFNSWSKIKVPT